MKKAILILTVIISALCAYSQSSGFQSPYKDGRPVADSLKDYSAPKGMNLLSAKRNEVPAKPASKPMNGQSSNTHQTKSKPVVLSPAKKP